MTSIWIAVRVGEAHALAAARLVDVLDRRGAFDARELFQVVRAAGVKGDADEFRLAELGDVKVVRRIGAAHVQRVFCAVGAHHAERGQEFLLLVEIGRAQPPISEIDGFDNGHYGAPKRVSVAHAAAPACCLYCGPGARVGARHRRRCCGRWEFRVRACRLTRIADTRGATERLWLFSSDREVVEYREVVE